MGGKGEKSKKRREEIGKKEIKGYERMRRRQKAREEMKRLP